MLASTVINRAWMINDGLSLPGAKKKENKFLKFPKGFETIIFRVVDFVPVDRMYGKRTTEISYRFVVIRIEFI